MLYLVIAIVFSAVIPIVLKYAHQKALSEEVILSTNYLVATLFSLLSVVVEKDPSRQVLDTTGRMHLVTIAIVTGFLFYGAFYFYQKSVRENGVSISIAVGKMGIIIPMCLSILIWWELPNTIQWIGILLSLAAIAIINFKPGTFKGSHIKSSLILFLIIGGMGDFANKFFEMTVGAAYSGYFLAVVFAAALVASLFETIRKQHIDLKSMAYGVGVGIPNMLTAFFFIRSLAVIKAAVVFPLYSGGAIVISMVYSTLVLKETLEKKEVIGIGIILLSLILVQWSMNA